MRAGILGTVMATLVLTGAAQTAGARDVDAPPLASDLLHSDLPLFGSDVRDKWPQSFSDDDGNFGCVSRVAFGTWSLKRADADADDITWYDIANYGVFHCWANVASATERERLAAATVKPSFFVPLETGRDHELWALQMGARPGSDYLLLQRKTSTAAITHFEVLQTDCPDSLRRRGGQVDILRTDYCAVPSREALLSLARRMSRLPPLGLLTLVSGSK